MKLLKGTEFVEDAWLKAADEGTIPLEADVIVGYGRWQAERDSLLQRNAALGLELPNDISPEELSETVVPWLDRLALIALDFPAFNDGRAYSQAFLLRKRHGFSGELRATGHVLRDQIAFMRRTGFDSLELPDHAQDLEWVKAFKDFSEVYQGSVDGLASIARKRHARAG